MAGAAGAACGACGGGVGVSPRFPNIAYFFLNIGNSFARADPPDLLAFGAPCCLPDKSLASS